MSEGKKKITSKGDKKKQLIKKALIDALCANLGNVTKACEAVGIGRKVYYEYLKDESFKFEVESIEESNIDFAESKLKELINGVSLMSYSGDEPTVYQVKPDVTATIFYLKTKGKKRGYVERQELTGKDGGAIEQNTNLTLGADVLKTIIEIYGSNSD